MPAVDSTVTVMVADLSLAIKATVMPSCSTFQPDGRSMEKSVNSLNSARAVKAKAMLRQAIRQIVSNRFMGAHFRTDTIGAGAGGRGFSAAPDRPAIAGKTPMYNRTGSRFCRPAGARPWR